MSLGEKIHKLRIKNNLSQGDLADALGVSRQSISKWETNSSVPELDKLVKLSETFGVSLDELVIGNAKGEDKEVMSFNQQNLPQIVYVEKIKKVNLSAVQILGIILLSCSVLCFVLFACFGRHNDLFDVLLLCTPVASLGFLCLVSKHPILWCSWCGSIIWWIYVFVLSAKWENATALLLVGIILVIASLIYTVRLHRNKQIFVPLWGWVILLLVLTAALFLLAVNTIPPRAGAVIKPVEIPINPDSSLVAE